MQYTSSMTESLDIECINVKTIFQILINRHYRSIISKRTVQLNSLYFLSISDILCSILQINCLLNKYMYHYIAL